MHNRKYLKRRLRKQLKGLSVSKDLDLLVYLNYVLFIKRLAEVSSDSAKRQATNRIKKGGTYISEQIIRNNTEQVLREFRG